MEQEKGVDNARFDKTLPRLTKRAEAAALFIEPNSTVLDVGCGRRPIRPFLPDSVRYLGIDKNPVEPDVLVFDLDRHEFPDGSWDITASALVHELLEARDEKRLLRLQRQLAGHKLLIIDELGYVPLSTIGAELLFEVFSQRYERGSTLVTSNLPFDEWTSVFGSERLTGALLDRLTHHVHILEMNGDSFRLAHSKRRSRRARSELPSEVAPQE